MPKSAPQEGGASIPTQVSSSEGQTHVTPAKDQTASKAQSLESLRGPRDTAIRLFLLISPSRTPFSHELGSTVPFWPISFSLTGTPTPPLQPPHPVATLGDEQGWPYWWTAALSEADLYRKATVGLVMGLREERPGAPSTFTDSFCFEVSKGEAIYLSPAVVSTASAELG